MARMQAALGASTHALPGMSPPGSFESEFLAFMRNSTPPRVARASRRSKRRRSNPVTGFGWPHGMHLRRVATAGQHGLRSLSGLWAVCAHNNASKVQFVEMSVQVASGGAHLRGGASGVQHGLALFVAEPSFSSRSMGATCEFWQQQGNAIEEAVQHAFSDSAMAAEKLTSWYTAPGGVETTRWSEIVESLGLQDSNRPGSGQGGVRDLSPESLDGNVDIAGLTNNMSLDGDLSEVQWQVQRVLTTVNTEAFPVFTVVEVVLHASVEQQVVVLLGNDDKYQIMQRIELP
jgi:hypothetical protein